MMGLQGIQLSSVGRRQRDQFIDSLIAQASVAQGGGQGFDIQATSPSSPEGAFNDGLETLFAQEFARPGGFNRIAYAMHPILKKRLDYHAIGRNNVLVLDTINTGDVPFYDTDLQEYQAVFLAGRGIPTRVGTVSKRFQLPTSLLGAVQEVPYEEIPIRRFPVFDRAKERVAIAIAIGEDDAIIGTGGVVDVAGNVGPNGTVIGSALDRFNIAETAARIVDKQLQIGAILMHSVQFAQVWKWSSNELDQVTLNKIVETGYIGTYLGAKLLISTRVPRTKVFLLTTPDKLGRIPERKAVEVKIFDNVPNFKYDIAAMEIIGLGIYNTAGVAVLQVPVSF